MAEYIERNAFKAKYLCCGYLPEMSEEEFDQFPVSDVAPVVRGRWEWFDEDVGTPVTGYEREWGWRCSHCGEELPDDYDDPDDSPTFRFCYNCGAMMRGSGGLSRVRSRAPERRRNRECDLR